MRRSRFCKQILVSVLLLGLFPLCGCAKTYRVTYVTGKGAFVGAKDTYRAGQQVTLKTGVVTDEIETVFLDGEILPPSDESDDGFRCYTFTMPDHDVEIELLTENISEAEPTILVDYLEQVVGIYEEPGEESGYYEMVLYDEGGSLLLEQYESGGTAREKVTRYRVPEQALTDAMAVITQYGMQGWNDRDDTFPIDGMRYVCKFFADGEMIRVTSDAMPDDGIAAFAAIRSTLTGYLRDEYRDD